MTLVDLRKLAPRCQVLIWPRQISQEQAQEHFGFLGFFAGRDPVTSSAKTRAKLGWNPVGPTLLTDLGNMRYSEA